MSKGSIKTARMGKLIVQSDGQIISEWRNRLKPQEARGYDRVRVGSKMVYVHRLVAEAFLLNPDNKPEVNHKGGNKKNNCVDNLEWVTKSENIIHAYRSGLNGKNRNKSLTA